MAFTRVRAVTGARHEFDAPLALVLSHPERYERLKKYKDVAKPRPIKFVTSKKPVAVTTARTGETKE